MSLFEQLKFQKINILPPKFGKSEYIYLSLNIGAIHNFFNTQPTSNVPFLLERENYVEAVTPSSKAFVDYKLTFATGLNIHFDSKRTEDFGMFTGVTLQQRSYIYNYEGVSGYDFQEDYKLTSIGIPLALKYGKDWHVS